MQRVPQHLSSSGRGPTRSWRRVLVLLFAGLLTIGLVQPTVATAHPGQAKLWVGDTSVVEPDTGTTDAKVKVVLKSKHYKAKHHGKTGKVKVYFKTVDGTATAGEDYTAVRGKGYLSLGKKKYVVAYINVPVLGDTVDEPDEYFKVLVKARGAKVKDGVGVVTIVDNDATPPPPVLPKLSVGDDTAEEGKAIWFKVSLDAPAPGTVTFDYATANGTAEAGKDYDAATGNDKAIAKGETHVWIKVMTREDDLDEPHEYFFLNISDVKGATVLDAQGKGIILDDDPAPKLPDLVVRDLSVDEGNVANFQIWLSAPAPQAITFDFTTVDAAAKAGQDYDAKTGNDVVIPKGATGATVSVQTKEDSLDEPDEDFLLRVSDVKGATVLKAQGRAVIVDDDVAKPSLTIKDVQVEEGKRAVLEVHLSAASTETVAVDFKTYDGSATQGKDYTATDGTLFFTAGVTVRRIAVETLEDSEVEGAEKFGVLLTNPRNATIADGQGRVDILDNDK